MFVFSVQSLERLCAHRAYCMVGNRGFSPEGDTELKIHFHLVTWIRMPGGCTVLFHTSSWRV